MTLLSSSRKKKLPIFPAQIHFLDLPVGQSSRLFKSNYFSSKKLAFSHIRRFGGCTTIFRIWNQTVLRTPTDYGFFHSLILNIWYCPAYCSKIWINNLKTKMGGISLVNWRKYKNRGQVPYQISGPALMWTAESKKYKIKTWRLRWGRRQNMMEFSKWTTRKAPVKFGALFQYLTQFNLTHSNVNFRVVGRGEGLK